MGAGSSGAKIVVIDDSRLILEVIQAALERHGYHVITISNPFGFSNLLRKEQPALALVDVNMPALLGNKLVEIALKAGGHACRIVLYSDRPEPELKSLAAKCGANGYICKNGDMELLVQSVERFLRG